MWCAERREGELGAEREEEEAEEEKVPEGRTEVMLRGVLGGKARRKEEERETVGRSRPGVVEPCEGRGGTGVEEGWRSSRWRWRRERMRGSKLIGSYARELAAVAVEQREETYRVVRGEEGGEEVLERFGHVLFVDAVVCKQFEYAFNPASTSHQLHSTYHAVRTHLFSSLTTSDSSVLAAVHPSASPSSSLAVPVDKAEEESPSRARLATLRRSGEVPEPALLLVRDRKSVV